MRAARCRASTSIARACSLLCGACGRGLEIKERAFKAYQAEGDGLRAAFLALDIARNYGFMGKSSIASAWMRRAGCVGPGETYAHGYLALVRSELATRRVISTRPEPAERAVEIGNRAADADLRRKCSVNLGS